MKHEAISHPKMHDLSERIRMPLFAAIGIMEALWHYTGSHAPRGDIGRATDSAICRAIDWRKKPDALLVPLVDSKWLDSIQAHRLIVHDWPDHAQEWVRKKLTRAKPPQDWLPEYGRSLYSVSNLSRQKQDSVSHTTEGIGLGLGLGLGLGSQGSPEGIWETAGFGSSENFEAWWVILVAQHPNRNRNAVAKTKAIELIISGQLTRTEFESSYQVHAASWGKGFEPNLWQMLDDFFWKHPPRRIAPERKLSQFEQITRAIEEA